MNNFLKKAAYMAGALAMATALSQAPLLNAQAAGKSAIVTESSSKKDNVTVTVSQTKNHKISSGRITLLFDENILTLSDKDVTACYQLVDVNDKVESNEKKGVSVAFADRKTKNGNSDLITVDFKVKSKAAGQNVNVDVVVNELYENDKALDEAGKSQAVSVKTDELSKWVGQVKDVSIFRFSRDVKISYDKIKGVDGYEVYRMDTKDGSYKKIFTTNETAVHDNTKNLKNGHTYKYRVRAFKTIDGVKVFGEYSKAESFSMPAERGLIGSIIDWIYDLFH